MEMMMQAKAFGKFAPSQLHPLRPFEAAFRIPEREGPAAWRSGIPSIQNFLNHLARYTRCESSREKYLRHLLQFCRWCGLTPEQLAQLPIEQAQSLVQTFADQLAEMGRSKAYVNTVLKRLKTFFRANGCQGLKLATQFVPVRYRKAAEYIPTKTEIYSMADVAGSPRNRAIILILWSSGVRVSTLCALNYGDIATEMEESESRIMIPIYPAMKERVPDACKGSIPYYTFVCPEAVEALRAYLKEREEKYGRILPDDPLLHSGWTLWSREERSTRRLTRNGVLLIVKKAAKLAGVPQWNQVASHCLRKAFESVLRSPTIDGGRMDPGTQQFLFGHILPGTQDVYYDKTRVDYHREEYGKLDFSRGSTPPRTVDKIVNIAELSSHFEQGWIFVAKISEGTAVVRKSG